MKKLWIKILVLSYSFLHFSNSVNADTQPQRVIEEFMSHLVNGESIDPYVCLMLHIYLILIEILPCFLRLTYRSDFINGMIDMSVSPVARDLTFFQS